MQEVLAKETIRIPGDLPKEKEEFFRKLSSRPEDPDKLEELKAQLELKDCTFKPQIDPLSSKLRRCVVSISYASAYYKSFETFL
jgi:hypothetical protein